jgi:hypothetical protein
MNILHSHKHVNKSFFVIVLLCLLILNFGSAPATAMNAPSPSDEYLTTCVPTITFTSVPRYGNIYQTFLYGRVDCIIPADFKVALYIYVAGGWWTKPYWNAPLTSINNDGTWYANIVTGGIDQVATRIAAFILPNGIYPPSMAGGSPLPQELFDSSVAHLIINRKIEFSGYTWNVKHHEDPVGPGPNRFSASEDNVWVDASGNLHLTITYENNNWYCTEVFTDVPLGYGDYTFTTASPIDQLDKNVVLGLFTWDDTAPEYNYREIDIEFSKWGDALNDNSQYVVQPWDHVGNIHRFDSILEGLFSTHSFKWESDQVFFSSHQGHMPSLEDEIDSWLYTGADVPPEGEGNARINLWLFNGTPPSDGKNVEVVIEAFNHDPAPKVKTITRADPNPTVAASVDFTVTFSESVKDVDSDDFTLTTDIADASITTISGSDATYTVTVNTGTGDGTIRLDVPETATIADLADNPLANLPFTDGETYSVDKSPEMAITADTPDPSVTGQAVTVTVTVTGAADTPTGTVDITGADTNCSITLADGTGSCNVIFNSTGTKMITATYLGDSHYSDDTDTEAHQVATQRAKNGGFNTYISTSKIPKYWVKSATFASTDGKDTSIKKEGSASVRISGATGKTKTLTQTLSLSGVKGQPFTFSYWVKGSAMPTKGSCYGQVLFYYGSTLKGTKTLKCPTGATYTWKNVKLNLTAPATYNKVLIRFTYSKASGRVWFDLASLLR